MKTTTLLNALLLVLTSILLFSCAAVKQQTTCPTFKQHKGDKLTFKSKKADKSHKKTVFNRVPKSDTATSGTANLLNNRTIESPANPFPVAYATLDDSTIYEDIAVNPRPVPSITNTTVPATPTASPVSTNLPKRVVTNRAPQGAAPALVSASEAPTSSKYDARRTLRKALKANKKADDNDGDKETKGKSQLIALILCILVGALGIHRFYLGYTGIGIIQLFTGGGFGIWALIDLIRIAVGDLQPKDGTYSETLDDL
jgi:TM2 domain-containing membrane protein YozV